MLVDARVANVESSEKAGVVDAMVAEVKTQCSKVGEVVEVRDSDC